MAKHCCDDDKCILSRIKINIQMLAYDSGLRYPTQSETITQFAKHIIMGYFVLFFVARSCDSISDI